MSGVRTLGDLESLRSVMVSDRSRHLTVWKEIAEFMSPSRIKTNPHNSNDGSRKDKKILKNAAGLALRTFVSGMMNGATPQSRPWFNLTVTDRVAANDTSAKRYFSESESILNSHFQVSNLYRVLPTSYKDVALFSNSAFAMLPHDVFGFWFYPFAVGSYCIGSDFEGNVNSFTRDFSLTARQVVERYGTLKPTGHIDWDNSLNDYIKSLWESKRYQDRVVLTNTILPNMSPSATPLFSKDKVYQSYTYLQGGGGYPNQSPRGFANSGSADMNSRGGSSQFLSIKGYDYFPVIAPRWEVQSEDDWGSDGPGHLALGYVKTLQEKEKYRMEAVAKIIKPPMIGPAALRRHQASILAGGITYIDESEKGTFRPAFQVDPKINELVQSQLEDISDIKSCFYEDLFLMLAGDRPTSHVTAREIEERSAEKLQAISPVLGQLDHDQNGRIIENAYMLLSQAGKLPKLPKVLQGKTMRPEYISVLAQAAKASQMVSVERAVNFTSSLAQVTGDRSLMQMLNNEMLLRKYYEYVGIDPTLSRDESEFAQIRNAIALQAQQQAQAQQMAQAAQTAKDMSQAKVGEDSVLDSFMGEQ